jgi:hypothetical protein
MIFKSGAPFPFNKIMPYDATGGEKLYKPFQQSAWVQRAIKKVSGPCAAVSLNFSLHGQAYDDPALAQFWRQPAVRLSRHDFLEATIGWLKMEGEAFWIMDDRSLVPFPGPANNPLGPGVITPVDNYGWGASADAAKIENCKLSIANLQFPPLIVARPDRMWHLVSQGILRGWDYVDADGIHHGLLPEQVIQIKHWNPYNEWRGLAEMHSAKDAAEGDYFWGKFSKNLAANNGDQGVFIIAKSGVPSDDQRQQIIDQLREKRELQQRGVFKPMFLTGDISVEDPKVRALDANAIATRLENRHEIALAFGVPPSMFDVKAAYSIGSNSDWFMLITETCIPTGNKICAAIDAVNLRLTGQPILSSLDWDEHPVIQAVRRERVDTAQKYWQMGVPLKVLNDYLDLELPDMPGWDVGYLPFSVAPVGELSPVNSPAFAEESSPNPNRNPNPGSSPAIDALRSALDPISRCRQALSAAAPPIDNLQLKSARESRWQTYMAQRRSTIKAYESRFNRHLMTARAEVLSKLEGKTAEYAEHAEKGTSKKSVAADFVFDIDVWQRGLLATLRPVATAALATAAKDLCDEIGVSTSIPTPETVIQFISLREKRLCDVAQEIFNDIKKNLQDGIDAGDTMAQLADRVRAAFNECSKGCAMRIAMTETAAAFGYSRNWAMSTARVPFREWLTSANANVPPAHQQANHQVVAIDEPFQVGGEPLMYPGDPSGSPENVINCHCVAIPRFDSGESSERVPTGALGKINA